MVNYLNRFDPTLSEFNQTTQKIMQMRCDVYQQQPPSSRIFWSKQELYNSEWCIKERAWCSSTTAWTTYHLCIMNPNWNRTTVLQHREKIVGYSLCTWQTKPLHIWIHHNSTIRFWTTDEHMEENHYSSQSNTPKITPKTVIILYKNRISTG